VSEPTPRQVLYGLVAAGFWAVVLVLTIGAATAGVSPVWWTSTLLALLVGAGLWMGFNWKRTGPTMLISIGLFVVWLVGTLIVAA
jgi:hypothetical protein